MIVKEIFQSVKDKILQDLQLRQKISVPKRESLIMDLKIEFEDSEGIDLFLRGDYKIGVLVLGRFRNNFTQNKKRFLFNEKFGNIPSLSIGISESWEKSNREREILEISIFKGIVDYFIKYHSFEYKFREHIEPKEIQKFIERLSSIPYLFPLDYKKIFWGDYIK